MRFIRMGKALGLSCARIFCMRIRVAVDIVGTKYNHLYLASCNLISLDFKLPHCHCLCQVRRTGILY